MSVSDGQPVNAAVTNAAFMSRLVDTSTVGKVALNDTGSTALTDIQKDINDIFSTTGIAGENDTNSKVYSTNEIIVDGDSYKSSIEKLDLEFNNSTGHAHSGAVGDGGVVSASNLGDFNKYWAVYQSGTFASASGTSVNVTSLFTGKSPNGGASSIGIITSSPNNLAHIVDSSTQTFIEDAGGQRVYGRITESAGTWTLSFYTNEAGVETAHSLTSTNINFIYWEVFDQEFRPTIPSNPFEFGTLDVTADVTDAGSTQRGVLNPSLNPQIIGGNKEWQGYQDFLDKVIATLDTDSTTTGSGATIPMVGALGVKLTNASLVSVNTISGAFGSNNQLFIVFNSTGASISLVHNFGSGGFFIPGGSDLTMKNNSSAMFFYDTSLSRWILMSGFGDRFSLASFGTSPNANGASYNTSSGAFNLEPASSSFPGGISSADQEFPAFIKKFNNFIASNIYANSTITGSNQELPNPNASYATVSDAGLLSIAMIAPPSFSSAAFWLILTNKTGNTISILDETGATASKRILTGTAADIDLANDASLFLVYDYNALRWRVIGGTGSGSGTRTFVTKTANYSILNSDNIIYIDASSSNVVLTLPNPAGSVGKTFTVKRIDNTSTFYGSVVKNSTETIDGLSEIILNRQYEFYNFYSDGSNWSLL